MLKNISKLIIVFVFILSYSCEVQAGIYYYFITADELKQRLDDPEDNGFLVIDVGTKSEYDTSHIPGAVSIPLKELGYRVWSLDKSKDIILYCRKDIQSKIAAQILINAGFKDVYDLVGGLKDWGYPIETGYGMVDI